MISQSTEYALRAVTHLAYNVGKAQTTKQICEATRVPVPYLSKILQGLSHAGLVQSRRGIRGGYALARSPADLTVWDVVQSVDPMRRILTCPLGLASHGTNLCPLHRRLDRAMELVEAAFKKSTIADIITEPSSSKPLCAVADPTAPYQT